MTALSFSLLILSSVGTVLAIRIFYNQKKIINDFQNEFKKIIEEQKSLQKEMPNIVTESIKKIVAANSSQPQPPVATIEIPKKLPPANRKPRTEEQKRLLSEKQKAHWEKIRAEKARQVDATPTEVTGSKT